MRKLARDETLPPSLLLFVTALDMYLLVDGHDRLQAALLEGRAPRLLALSRVRDIDYPADENARRAVIASVSKGLARPGAGAPSIDRLNRALIAAFADPRFTISRTRAFPILGGRAQWESEVAARLVALGPAAERNILGER